MSIHHHGPQLAATLGLLYLPDAAPGEVCYANDNAELRDDFKQVITPADVADYLHAVLHAPELRERHRDALTTGPKGVPYPKDADTFWALVRAGGVARRGW